MSGADEPESDEWLGGFGLWEDGRLVRERERESCMTEKCKMFRLHLGVKHFTLGSGIL